MTAPDNERGGDVRASLAALTATAQAQFAENHGDEELAQAGIVFRRWRDFIAHEPPPFDWIVENIVAKGFKGDLCAKSKQGKSFFGMQLALCVASGRDFLGMRVPRARRTAYFNLELIERGAWERGERMGKTLNADVGDTLYIVNLRGTAGRLREHTAALVAEVKRLGIDLIILDPRYKLIAEGEDENNAAGLRGVLEFRDALAEAAAVLLIGHDPKGDTAGKSMADRGAGSYTAGADYDFCFALSPHEAEGKSVLSTSCRYRSSPPDLTVRFDPESLTFDAEADTPAAVRQTRRGAGGANADPKGKAERERLKASNLEKAVREYFNDRPQLIGIGTFRLEMSRAAEGASYGRDTLRVAIDALIERGVIAKTAKKERDQKTGKVKRVKNGGWLVGTPERVKAYDADFEEPPAQPS